MPELPAWMRQADPGEPVTPPWMQHILEKEGREAHPWEQVRRPDFTPPPEPRQFAAPDTGRPPLESVQPTVAPPAGPPQVQQPAYLPTTLREPTAPPRPSPYPGVPGGLEEERGFPGFGGPYEGMEYTPSKIGAVTAPFEGWMPATQAEMRYRWQQTMEPPSEEDKGISGAWRNFREKLQEFSEAPGQITPGPFGMITPLPRVSGGEGWLEQTREKTALARQTTLAAANVATGGLWRTLAGASYAIRLPGGGEIDVDVGAIPRAAGAGLRTFFVPQELVPEEVYGRYSTTPRIYREMTEEYGESRELYDAVHRSGGLAWSGYERQKRAAERMFHGESYGSALYGDYGAGAPVRSVAMAAGAVRDEDGDWFIPDEAMPGVIQAIQQTPDVAEYYGYYTEIQGEDPRDVAETVLNEGIPGEQNAVAELTGRILIDLMNMPGYLRTAGRVAGKAGIIEMRFSDDAFKTVGKLSDLGAEEIYESTKTKGFWSNLLDQIPQSKQSSIISLTRDMVKNMVVQQKSPEDQIEALQAYAKLGGSTDEAAEGIETLNKLGLGRWEVDDARWAAEAAGVDVGDVLSPYESEAGKLGAYLWRQMFTDAEGNYDPEALAKAVKGADTTDDAVQTLINKMVTTADELYPVKDPTPIYKVNRAIKGFFAKYLHMGWTSAYAFRNAVQNTVQGIIDNVNPFVRKKKIDAFLDTFGFTPAAALRGLGEGGPGGALLHEKAQAEKALKGEQLYTAKDIIQSGPALWLSGQFEEAAGVRAVYAGMKNMMTRHLRPGMLIPQDEAALLASKLGDDVAEALISEVMTKYNPRDWGEVLETIAEKENIVELWRHLDPQTVSRLGELDMLDSVNTLLKSAETKDDFIRGIQVLVEQAYAKGDEFTETAFVPAGTAAADVQAALDSVVEGFGGWEKLPYPISNNPENYIEGQVKIAQNAQRIAGAKDRALYYAAKAGDEDLVIDLLETYARMEGAHNGTMQDVAELKRVIIPQIHEAADAGDWEKVESLWKYLGDETTGRYHSHYDEIVEEFGRIADAGKEMGEGERADELIRFLSERMAETPVEVGPRVDVDTLIETAAEQMGYGGTSPTGRRPHLANTLAQEFDEVAGETVDEKLESFVKALEEGKLDPDDVWDTLWRHQTQHPERIPGAEEITEELSVRLPEHADDLARTLGIDPAEATAEDWARVAEEADRRANDLLTQGDEALRGMRVEREAQRMPEPGWFMGEWREDLRRGAYGTSWMTERGRELSAEAFEEGLATTNWMLGELGFSPDELGQLSGSRQHALAQRNKLLEEITSGELLRTESGNIRKIDDIPIERRRELIESVSGAAIERAQGVLSGAEQYMGWQYKQIAEDAALRVEAIEAGAELPIREAGRYTLGGFPTTGGGIPLGEVAETRLKLPGRPEAPEFFRPREEAPSLWRRLGQIMDDGHMPTPQEVSNGIAPEIEDELLSLQGKVLAQWGQTSGKVENLEAAEDFLEMMKPRVNALRSVAVRVGEAARDFAYHNYSDRRNIDMLMGYVWQYPFWYTRTYTKWAQRAMDQPHTISAYYNLRDYLHEVNKDLPEWWRDQIKVADVLGESYYMPLQGLINPLEGLVDSFRSEERARVKIGPVPAGQIVENLESFGMSTHVLMGAALAVSAYMQGDTEAALAWMGYQSAWSRAAVGITAGMRDTVPGAEGVIPPGGMNVEPWMWEMTEDGPRAGGSIYDKKRIGYILSDKVKEGEISPADSELAAYFTSGPIYDDALQQHALSRLMPNLVSWLVGTGAKPRREYEVEISRMWELVNDLHRARETEQMTGDEYSEAWRELKRRYPYFNTIMMTRMDDDAKDEALTWAVINRLPPGWKRAQTFQDEDIEQLLHQFYEDSGDMSEWSDDERRKFMAGVIKLAREKDTPTERQQSEWDEARRRYKALRREGEEKFGSEIIELENEYFALPPSERSAFADKHPELVEYWDWWNEAKGADPLLNEYYERPPEFWTQSDARGAFFDSYFSSVPPGGAEWALKDDLPLLNAMRDYDVREWLEEQGWTVEQYKAAIAQVEDWIREHPDQIIGDPQEWERAREINSLYWDRREVLFPNYSDLIDEYMDLDSREAQRKFQIEHPELPAFWEWRTQFAKNNQLWAKYYRPEDYEGEMAGAPAAGGAPSAGGAPARGTTSGGYAGRTYGGGGGGLPIRTWQDFMMQATPDAVRELLQGQPGPALKELHARIGRGSLEEWMARLLDLYRSQFKPTTRTPSVQYAHWLSGTRRT